MDMTTRGDADALVETLLTSAPDLPAEFTVRLRRPIELAGLSHAVLTMREPTVRDLEDVANMGDTEADAHLLGALSGVPVPALLKMAISDFRASRAAISPYLDAPTVIAADVEPPAAFTVTLRKPVSYPSVDPVEHCASLELREPTVAEWQEIEKKTGLASDIAAVRILTGFSEHLIARIPFREFAIATGYLARFFVPAPARAGAS